MGTPRPESSAVRAHVPGAFWAFANSWRDIFHTGVCDHAIKELAPSLRLALRDLRVLRQPALDQGGRGGKLNEAQDDDLINFEKSAKYNEREKAALAYAEAITWRLDTDDTFWERMHKHFSEPELVELGCFIALTMGQQSWLRLLNIEHHQVMAGTSASMAPGFETAEALAKSKASAGLLGEERQGGEEKRSIAALF